MMLVRLFLGEVLTAFVFGGLLFAGLCGADRRRGQYNAWDRLGLLSLAVLFLDCLAVVATAAWAIVRL
jgi:hypothetical protein